MVTLISVQKACSGDCCTEDCQLTPRHTAGLFGRFLLRNGAAKTLLSLCQSHCGSLSAAVQGLGLGEESTVWDSLEGVRAWFVPLLVCWATLIAVLAVLDIQDPLFCVSFYLLSEPVSASYLSRHPNSFRKEVLTIVICCCQLTVISMGCSWEGIFLVWIFSFHDSGFYALGSEG